MATARVTVRDRYCGEVAVTVSVQEVEPGVVRVLSARPLVEGCDATLAVLGNAGAAPVTVHVTRCRRLITGLYDVSLVTKLAGYFAT